jgi:hypothetical protein
MMGKAIVLGRSIILARHILININLSPSKANWKICVIQMEVLTFYYHCDDIQIIFSSS